MKLTHIRLTPLEESYAKGRRDQREEDAALMADLLEVARAFEVLMCSPSSPIRTQALRATAEAARAAIAKATGSNA